MTDTKFWARRAVWQVAYAGAAIAAGLLKWRQGRVNGDGYTTYENYLIFKNAFQHLAQGLNPYAPYPAEQWDLFKYSPSFAIAMAPFSVLPDYIGLPLWNLLNALPLLGAVIALPHISGRNKTWFVWLILPELFISMQNSQSNGLTAALLLWAYVAFERGRAGVAAFCAVAGAFIKIFGIFVAVPAWLYPEKRIKFGLWAVIWTLAFLVAPLIVLSPAQLQQVYAWWLELLQSDHSASTGLSVAGWLRSWFGWSPDKTAILAVGALILVGATLAADKRGVASRAAVWAAMLIWVVIFNHKAESPTFVIAMCGAALYYFSMERPQRMHTALLLIAFIAASLTPTDLFPRAWRAQWIEPYTIKAVPFIIIWAVICLQLMLDYRKNEGSSA